MLNQNGENTFNSWATPYACSIYGNDVENCIFGTGIHFPLLTYHIINFLFLLLLFLVSSPFSNACIIHIIVQFLPIKSQFKFSMLCSVAFIIIIFHLTLPPLPFRKWLWRWQGYYSS